MPPEKSTESREPVEVECVEQVLHAFCQRLVSRNHIRREYGQPIGLPVVHGRQNPFSRIHRIPFVEIHGCARGSIASHPFFVEE
jgi:hypothetical protein